MTGAQVPPRRSFDRGETLLLAGSSAVVPWVFWTGSDDVFYLPKLVALWVAICILGWWVAARERAGSVAGDSRAFVPAIDGPVGAFVVLGLVAAAWSTDPATSLLGAPLQHQGVLTLVLYVGFFALPRLIDLDLRQSSRVLAATAVGGVGVAAYALVQWTGLDPVWGESAAGDRAFSSIGQPNALAAYLVVVMPIAAGFAAVRVGTARWAVLGAVGLMATALVLTASRGGIVGLAVVALVGAGALRLAERPVGRSQGMAVGGWGALGLVAAVAAMVVVSVVAGGRWAESATNHVDTWRVAVAMVADRPVLGTGPETFAEQFPTYGAEVLSPERAAYFAQYRVESPHNHWLAIASGSGLPALGAYVALVAAVATRLCRTLRTTTDRRMRIAMVSLLAAIAGHLATDSFMTAEVTSSWLFWLLMGVGVQLHLTLRSEVRRGSEHSELVEGDAGAAEVSPVGDAR